MITADKTQTGGDAAPPVLLPSEKYKEHSPE